MAANKLVSTGKKTKGRKRHIVTDTLGCLLALKIHKANLHDTKAGIFPAIEACRKYSTIQKYCGDSGYRGSFVANLKSILGLDVDISAKIIPEGWKVIPKRWIVERTFAWLNNSRRLSKDYELLTSSAESIIILSHCHTLLKHL